MFNFKSDGPLPPRSSSKDMLRGFFGGFFGVAILGLLTHVSGAPLLIAPFGASCVLLFTAPAAPFSQPRNLIGGNLLTSLIGLIMYYLFKDFWFAMPLAVGISIVAMQATRTLHPPAGANPLVIFLTGKAGIGFLMFPILGGAIILLVVALIINNISAKQKYPLYWLGKKP